MKAIDAIKQIKVMLGMDTEVAVDSEVVETVPNETEIELAEAELVDGTIVKADSFTEGAALFVVTEEGDIPAPVGVHETTDGKLVTVEEEGIIAKVEDKPEEAVVEESEAEFENTVSLSEEAVATIMKSLEAIAEKMVAMENRITTVDEAFHAFKEEPAGKKITNNLNEVQKSENDLATARFEKILEFRKQTKK